HSRHRTIPISTGRDYKEHSMTEEFPADEMQDATPLTPASSTPQRKLSAKQQEILEVIKQSVLNRGYPPSMREIGDMVGLSSLSSVSHQMGQLESAGYIKRDPNRPRALEIVGGADSEGSS